MPISAKASIPTRNTLQSCRSLSANQSHNSAISFKPVFANHSFSWLKNSHAPSAKSPINISVPKITYTPTVTNNEMIFLNTKTTCFDYIINSKFVNNIGLKSGTCGFVSSQKNKKSAKLLTPIVKMDSGRMIPAMDQFLKLQKKVMGIRRR